MITVDASVHINALNPTEAGSADSKAFLEWLQHTGHPVTAPTLLLVEVAAAVARSQNDSQRGIQAMQHLQELPGHTWLSLDRSLAALAATLGAHHRLRGADAVYAAVAHHTGGILVTADRKQLERLQDAITVLSPAQALHDLPEPQPTSAEDVLKALRGRGRGERLVERLLEERRKDRDREA